MQGIKIREAVREDCQAIRGLIQDLADFEKMSDGPKVNSRGKKTPKIIYTELADGSGKSEDVKLGLKILEEDGFDSEHPFFECYVAEAGEKLVGYALYYYTYSTWNGKAMCLEDLYVTPDFRKKHVGSTLFKTVAKKAADSRCCRLDFMVLNWNPAQDFYKTKGAVDLTEQDGWHHYRLEGAALKDLATTV